MLAPVMLITLLVLAACQPNPQALAARQYLVDLDPLLLENGLVAERLLVQAGAVHDAKAQPKDTYQAWSTDIVPLAEHLRDEAAALNAPPEWLDAHKDLVAIWSTRADGYRDIDEAVEIGDPKLFKQGRDQADTAKLREESWFRDTNARLETYGLYVDQFPDPALR